MCMCACKYVCIYRCNTSLHDGAGQTADVVQYVVQRGRHCVGAYQGSFTHTHTHALERTHTHTYTHTGTHPHTYIHTHPRYTPPLCAHLDTPASHTYRHACLTHFKLSSHLPHTPAHTSLCSSNIPTCLTHLRTRPSALLIYTRPSALLTGSSRLRGVRPQVCCLALLRLRDQLHSCESSQIHSQ